jgi:tetratricopeptide (TPR) repeat protein
MRSICLLVFSLLAVQTPDPVEVVKQARTLSADGKQDEALALYRQALNRAPELFDAHLGSGISLDLLGRYGEAQQHFAKAIQAAPDAAGKDQALAAMGVSYAFAGAAKQSATFYRQLFDRQTTASDLAGAAATANALGRVYLEAGDFDNALKWYQTGYETSRRQTKLPPDQADLWDLRWAHAQARVAARKGRAAEARTQTAVVKQLLDKGTNPDQQIQYPYLEGYVALYLKDYPGAVAALTRADQKDPFILVLLAQAYEKLHDLANARQCYTEALASNAHSLNNAFARPLAKKRLAR